MTELRRVKVWTPIWWDRDKDDPKVECLGADHFADTWFVECEHTPEPYEFVESARALCDEINEDHQALEVISDVYFQAWMLHRRRGVEHVNQWPLALCILAGLREAGYEVIRKEKT